MTSCVTQIITSLNSRVWTSVHTLSASSQSWCAFKQAWMMEKFHCNLKCGVPVVSFHCWEPLCQSVSESEVCSISNWGLSCLNFSLPSLVIPVPSRLWIIVKSSFFVGSWSLWLTVSFPSPSGRDWATWAFQRVQFSINHYCWLLWIRFNSSFMKSRHWSWFDNGCSITSCVTISLTPTWWWQSVHLTYFWANQKLC